MSIVIVTLLSGAILILLDTLSHYRWLAQFRGESRDYWYERYVKESEAHSETIARALETLRRLP